MTDNEIIKALECCISSGDCKGCPSYIEKDDDCLGIKWSSILDLINRQQAEIERLQKTIDKLKLDMSYMSSPNAIGDKHEMGCW